MISIIGLYSYTTPIAAGMQSHAILSVPSRIHAAGYGLWAAACWRHTDQATSRPTMHYHVVDGKILIIQGSTPSQIESPLVASPYYWN